MSLGDELSELTQNIRDTYDTVEDMGGEIPEHKNTQNLATAVSSISLTATWGEIQGDIDDQTDLAEALEDRYTKAEVDNLVSTIPTFSVEVVQTLPTEDISETTIYLVPAEESAPTNSYDEYIYVSGNWEHIGSTSVDLSDYYTKAEVDNVLNDKLDKTTTFWGQTESNGVVNGDVKLASNSYWLRLLTNANSAKIGFNSSGDITLYPRTDTTAPVIYAGASGIPARTSRITLVTDPTNAQDAATKNYVDTNLATKANVSALPTRTSDLTNDGSDGNSTYVEADELGTVATTNDYTDLDNLPTVDTATSTTSTNAVSNSAITTAVNNEATVRSTADATLQGNIDAEASTRSSADTALQGDISTINTAINKNVVTDIVLDSNPSTTLVQLDTTKTNIKTSATTTGTVAMPVASSTQAGVMNSATFNAIAKNTQDIANIIGEVVAVTGLPANPTQAQLTTAWLNASGESELINGAGIYDVTNTKRWTYYANDTTWHYLDAEGSVEVNTWTNNVAGIVKGSTADGQIFAESDGTGSVNGWDTLTSQVATNTSKLSTIATGAEVNVQSNWTETNTSSDAYIQNKPTLATVATTGAYSDLSGKPNLATVATSGSYTDLTNKPTIPTVNNATLTIQKNGTAVQTFTANSSTNKTANITVPTAISDLTNDSDFVEQVTVELTANWNTYVFTYSGITYANLLAAVQSGKRVLIKANGPLSAQSNYTTGKWIVVETSTPETLKLVLEFEGIQYNFTFNNSGTDGSIEEKKIKSNNIDSATYSTSEQAIGTWVDGRTIYRKCFVANVNGVQTHIFHGISNLDAPLNVYGWYKGDSQLPQPIPRVVPDNASYGIGVGDFTSSEFLFLIGTSNVVPAVAQIVVEYVKAS